MNPLLKKSLDPSTMSEQERKLFEMYGKKPVKNVLSNMQKERKYFDSGDYAMHKAGVSSDLGGRPLAVGTAIPTPEGLPHASPPSLSSSPTNTSGSPPLFQTPNPFLGHRESISGPSGYQSPPSSNPLLAPHPSAHHPSTGSFSMGDGAGVGVGVGSGVGMPIPGGGRSDPRRSPPTAFSPLTNATGGLAHHPSISKPSVPPSSFPIQHAHQHRESMSLSSGSGSPVRLTGSQAAVVGSKGNEQAVADDEEGMEMD
jgi:hypothetical protein